MATGVIVAGLAGRMGREIAAAVMASGELELIGGFERPDHPALGQDIGLLAGGRTLGRTLAGSLAETADGAEVVIDFTTVEASLANLAAAVELGLAAVVGTTGFSAEQKAEIAGLAEKRPIVLAPNMSIGVNVLYKLVVDAAKLLGDEYDIEIVEAHHKMKADAPSGTALALAERLAEARGWSLDEAGLFARHGRIGPRKEVELGVQTIRAGDIVGEHTVYLAGPGERLELIHRAHSRANFAGGAIRAAGWVVDKAPGLYDMQDVLGLK